VTTIALIGKPNVGKSSLFNRFMGKREAITSDIAGTTRDVKQRLINVLGKEAVLFDTGGLEDRDLIFKEVRKMSMKAAEKADIVLFMVDGKEFPDNTDKHLFFELQKVAKQIALVVNKIDNDKPNDNVYEYMTFGAETQFEVSVIHNRGVRQLGEWLFERIEGDVIEEEVEVIEKVKREKQFFVPDLEDEDENFTYDEEKEYEEDKALFDQKKIEEDENRDIKIAILGRPNVGKSSLLNRLVDEERSVVSPIAGTTIDPVDETIQYKDKKLTFVDTAGIRKRSRVEGIERYALIRSKELLEQANIALLVLDCSEPFNELDERIAGLLKDNKLGVIIVLNKYDIRMEEEHQEIIDDIRYRFKFLAYAPIITISALSGKRAHKINDLILEVYDRYCTRLRTSEFNNLLRYAFSRHHIPSDKGKVVKIYYGTQYATKPPQFALICNRPESLHFSYLRYLENRIREVIDLEGSPVVLSVRDKNQKKKDAKK
jgi:GTP-binding protein